MSLIGSVIGHQWLAGIKGLWWMRRQARLWAGRIREGMGMRWGGSRLPYGEGFLAVDMRWGGELTGFTLG